MSDPLVAEVDIVEGGRPVRDGGFMFRRVFVLVGGWGRVETGPAVVEHSDGEFCEPPRWKEAKGFVAIAVRKWGNPDDQGVCGAGSLKIV